MADLGKAYVQIIPKAEGISGKISSILGPESRSAGASAGTTIGEQIGAFAKKAIVALGIGKIIKDAITNGMEFETSMAKASTLFSGTSEEFAALQDRILGISSATGAAASQLAEAAYSAESASVPMGNLGDMIEASSKLATAGFTDIDTALSATAKTMNAYGMMSDDVAATQANMEKVQRILIQTQNKGITTVGELGASLAQVTGTAATANVSFEQVGAAMALMTARGTPTAQATTQLRSAIAELEKSGTQAATALAEAAEGTEYAGMSFVDMMNAGADLGDVMGMLQKYADASGVSMLDLWSSIEGGNAAIAIASDLEGFNSDLEAMSTSADVVGEAYNKMSDTVGFKLQRVKTSLQNVGIEAFSAVAAPLAGILDGISTVLAGIMPSLQEMGSAFMELCGAIGQVIGEIFGLEGEFSATDAIIAALTSVIEMVTGALQFLAAHAEDVTEVLIIAAAVIGTVLVAMNPIPALIAGIIAVGTLLYQNWDTICQWAGELRDRVVEVWENVKEKVVGFITDIKTKATEIWENIKTTVTTKVESIKSSVSSTFESIKSTISTAWENVKSGTSTAWGMITSTIQANGGGIQGIIGTVSSGIQTMWSGALSFLDSITGGKLSSIYQWFVDKFNAVQNFLSPIINWLKGLFNFSWSLPHIALPHFSITGSFSLMPPSVPHFSISWYKMGAIFDDPTVIGVGEAGPEAVLPLSGRQMRPFAQAVAEEMGYADDHRLLEQLLEFLQQYLPQMANMQMVTDTGALVGQLAPAMDARMGIMAARRERNG